MSEKAAATRARQACEPCRRKKTKCPGEKPTCSFCQRLGQRCSYEKGDDATARIHKARRSDSHDSTASRDRLQRLESRVEEVFDILSNFTNQTSNSQSSPAPAASDTAQRPTTRSSARLLSSVNNEIASEDPGTEAVEFHEPSEEVWRHLTNIYVNKFDYQPLSVLSPQTLSIPPTQWAKCLRHSFLSLTAPFLADGNTVDGLDGDAVMFYANSARHEIMKCVANGEVGAELLQAICLSSLREIMNSNSLGALINISTGIRLALATNFMSNRYPSTIPVDSDTRSRCCWSLFALDRMYSSTLTLLPALSTENVLPDYPPSIIRPRASLDPALQATPIKDLGVATYQLQLLSIWGIVMRYLQEIKDGQAEEAWSLKSSYNQIVVRLFGFETKYSQKHRFQQARMQEHTIETLDQQRGYWAPWLAGQFSFHVIQALINHPFLQIASKPRRQGFQPPSFLQNSIDQAVLHSSWVIKCIEVCEETGFQINDPFVAHLVAVVATIYLFLLNAKDEDLASQSRLGFDKCYSFIQSMASDWPHLQHTIDKLEILQREANASAAMPTDPSAPKAQRFLLWELLDYSASTSPSRVPEFTSDAVDLNVDTRFLSPLNPLSTGQTPATVIQQSVINTNTNTHSAMVDQTASDTMWDPMMDSLDFNLFDNEQMADLTNLTFGRDLWSFGQL